VHLVFWGWYSLETPLGERITHHAKSFRNYLHGYRWKGRLLRALLLAKLEDTSSAADAMDAFSRAAKIRADGLRRGENVASYPMHAAASLIAKEMRHSWVHKAKGFSSRDIDLIRYERFQNELRDFLGNNQLAYNEVARTWLFHPTAPSPDRMLGVLTDILNNPTAVRSQRLVSPRDQVEANYAYSILTQTAGLLLFHDRPKEADWVISKVKLYSPPRLTQYLDITLAGVQGAYRRFATAQLSERLLERPTASRQIPVPSFRFSPT